MNFVKTENPYRKTQVRLLVVTNLICWFVLGVFAGLTLVFSPVWAAAGIFWFIGCVVYTGALVIMYYDYLNEKAEEFPHVSD